MKFEKLVEKSVISGKGTKSDPYSAEDLTTILCQIKQKKRLVFFKDITFGSTQIKKSENLVFSNCIFPSLYIVKSKHLEFHKCNIESMMLSLSYRSSFRECSLSNISSVSSRENVFDSCDLTYMAKRNILFPIESQSKSFLFLSVIVLLLVGGLPFINRELLDYPSMSFVYGFSLVCTVALVLFFLLPMSMLLIRINKLDRNQIKEG